MFDYDKMVQKKTLETKIRKAIIDLCSIIKNPAEKEIILEYLSAINRINEETALPLSFHPYQPRSSQCNKYACIYSIINSIIKEWWTFNSRTSYNTIRLTDYLAELNEIIRCGLGSYTIMGSIKKGYYLFKC